MDDAAKQFMANFERQAHALLLSLRLRNIGYWVHQSDGVFKLRRVGERIGDQGEVVATFETAEETANMAKLLLERD